MPEIKSLYCILIFLIPAITSALILVGGINSVICELLAFLGMAATLGVSILAFSETQTNVLIYMNNHFRMDALSGLFGVLVSLIGLIVILYSFEYIEQEKERGALEEGRTRSFYWQIMLFISTMLCVVATNNIIMLWVLIEATTLASAILVAFYWNKEALEAGYKYLMLLTVGISFALFGCVLLYSGAAFHVTGGENPLHITVIAAIAKKGLIPPSIVLLSVAFFIVGFGTKAGVAPFHAWLPDAHAEAPSPISVLLSGVMIKVGIYALIRTISMFYSLFSIISIFVVILGLFTMILGVLMMFIQEDIKRFLAYSSVSQIGYIVLGFGLAGIIVGNAPGVKEGTYIAMYGSIFHIINHAIIKSLLFLCAGAVIFRTGIRKIEELGGLGKKMPVTAFCFFVASLAISGVPLLNGFMSKFTIFLAGVKIPGMIWTTIIAILCSILTLAAFIHVSYRIFMGPVVGFVEKFDIEEVPLSMWLGMILLGILCFVFGIYPQIIYPYLNTATNAVLMVIKGG